MHSTPLWKVEHLFSKSSRLYSATKSVTSRNSSATTRSIGRCRSLTSTFKRENVPWDTAASYAAKSSGPELSRDAQNCNSQNTSRPVCSILCRILPLQDGESALLTTVLDCVLNSVISAHSLLLFLIKCWSRRCRVLQEWRARCSGLRSTKQPHQWCHKCRCLKKRRRWSRRRDFRGKSDCCGEETRRGWIVDFRLS